MKHTIVSRASREREREKCPVEHYQSISLSIFYIKRYIVYLIPNFWSPYLIYNFNNIETLEILFVRSNILDFVYKYVKYLQTFIILKFLLIYRIAHFVIYVTTFYYLNNTKQKGSHVNINKKIYNKTLKIYIFIFS